MAEDHYLKRELYHRVQTDPALFDFLQSGALDGVWYWDLTAQEHEWMSPRMWEALGYPPDEMPHTPASWQALVHPEDATAAFEALKAHLADARVPYDQIIRYRHRTGRTVWIRCRGITVRDEDGTPTRMLGAHTDITPLKEAEQKLQLANHLLQQRSEDLEQFASIASHDLKSPIRQLGSLAVLLQTELDELGIQNETVSQVIDLIRKRAALALQMHNDLLEYATAGGALMPTEPLDLDALAREVWQAHEAPGFSLDLPAPLPTCWLPRVPVATVLSNLFSNAISHHDREQGTITVTAAEEGTALRLIVADDGPGIPEAFRQKVFEVFQTLRSRDDGGGTGLGLALVRKLTERFGEGTTLHANDPRGTRFETRWRTTPPLC